MSFETSQNSGFAPNEAPSSLRERVQRILAAKLTPRQIEEGFLYTKELMLVLGCSERTLIRWRKLRKQGDKTVEFLVTIRWGRINIILMIFTSISSLI